VAISSAEYSILGTGCPLAKWKQNETINSYTEKKPVFNSSELLTFLDYFTATCRC